MPTISATTQVLMDNELVLYRRERSNIWQCRYKVAGAWQRKTTKEYDLAKAKAKAKELMVEAEIRRRSNLPVVTRKFRDVAKLAIERMEAETNNGKGKVIYNDYIRVINDYLIPTLGKRNVTSIDYAALDELDAQRIVLMGKAPRKSTLQTQNAALNRVFDEAVIRGFLTEANRLRLEANGKASSRRPAFELNEIRALLAGFDGWIARARNESSKERRELMRDYVFVLLDTGARPGKELMNLKWKQIRESIKPEVDVTGTTEGAGGELEKTTQHTLNRSVRMTVSGKNKTREMLGMKRTVDALRSIAKRNYEIETPLLYPLANIAKPNNDAFVFRTRAGIDASSSFQKMFERYLKEHNLLFDPKTEQKRVFYSLRHTYATLALTHDKVPIHTLSTQMGTSVLMIEKHYSHLKVYQAIEQLRGTESRDLINAIGAIDAEYISNKT